MIFYFSGTGNTEWAAKRLAQRTSERMIFIADEMKKDRCEYELTEGERLGFCFPVHGWQPPHIVRQFIGKAVIKTLPDTFVYVLVTCGDSIGRTMEIFENELYKHHGLQAHSVFSLIMPESYVCLPFMYTDSQQREREKTEHAAKQLEVYGEMIDKRQQGQRRHQQRSSLGHWCELYQKMCLGTMRPKSRRENTAFQREPQFWQGEHSGFAEAEHLISFVASADIDKTTARI